jgi:hypothetical protein
MVSMENPHGGSKSCRPREAKGDDMTRVCVGQRPRQNDGSRQLMQENTPLHGWTCEQQAVMRGIFRERRGTAPTFLMASIVCEMCEMCVRESECVGGCC